MIFALLTSLFVLFSSFFLQQTSSRCNEKDQLKRQQFFSPSHPLTQAHFLSLSLSLLFSKIRLKIFLFFRSNFVLFFVLWLTF